MKDKLKKYLEEGVQAAKQGVGWATERYEEARELLEIYNNLNSQEVK